MKTVQPTEIRILEPHASVIISPSYSALSLMLIKTTNVCDAQSVQRQTYLSSL